MALPNMAMIPSGYKPTKLYSVLPTETYGSELVTNGDFATDSNWNKGTGWTISGGSANCDGTQTSQTNFFQVGIVPINVNYKVTFTTTVSAGGVILAIGGSNAQPIVTSSGTYTFTDKATSGDPNLYLSGNADFIGSIDNVSAQEVLVGDADFTVTRATSATRVNQQGLIETPNFTEGEDLITNGDFSDGSTDWAIENTWTIANGVASGNGANGNSQELKQNSVTVVGDEYKLTYEIKNYVSGSLRAASRGGFQAGNGVKTLIFLSPRAALAFLGVNFFGDITNIILVKTETNNIPRLDYTDGTCPVLLTEPAATNLITNSESFSSYKIGTSVITPNSITSPDGTNSGVLITRGSGALALRVNSVVDLSKTYTFSGYFKSSGSATEVLLDITDNNNTRFNLTNEWQRFSMTAESNPSGNGFVDVAFGPGTAAGITFYAWGLQVEESAYATSYIPTFGSAVTRNQDIVNNAGTSATYNSVEGTLFIEAARDSNDGNNGGFQINDGTSANNIRLFFNQTDTFSVITTVGGVNNVVKTANPITSSTVLNRLAVTWKLNDYKIWANGLQVASDTSAAVYPIGTLNNLDLINQINDYFDGKTSQIQVFNTALSDFDLQNLTSNATSYASYEIMRTSLNFNIQ